MHALQELVSASTIAIGGHYLIEPVTDASRHLPVAAPTHGSESSVAGFVTAIPGHGIDSLSTASHAIGALFRICDGPAARIAT